MEKVAVGAASGVSIVLLICSLFFSLFLLAIPIANIIVGGTYLNHCPIEQYIPIWLIVQGAVNIFVVVLFDVALILVTIMGIRAAYDSVRDKIGQMTCKIVCLSCTSIFVSIFFSIISLFALAWFIAGNVWVFSNASSVQFTNSSLRTFCNQTVYLYAFWSIIATYIITLLSCCCSCFASLGTPILACVGIGARA